MLSVYLGYDDVSEVRFHFLSLSDFTVSVCFMHSLTFDETVGRELEAKEGNPIVDAPNLFILYCEPFLYCVCTRAFWRSATFGSSGWSWL